jgi:hypothetical protein
MGLTGNYEIGGGVNQGQCTQAVAPSFGSLLLTMNTEFVSSWNDSPYAEEALFQWFSIVFVSAVVIDPMLEMLITTVDIATIGADPQFRVIGWAQLLCLHHW